ncbi:hypothetical protein, partial [Streptomyces sp. LS1784]
VPLLAAAALVTLVCAGTAAVPGVRRHGARPSAVTGTTSDTAPEPTAERPPARAQARVKP